MQSFDELVAIVARLRGDNGCSWDRAQTPKTMRPYLLEEAYEVLDALDRGDSAELRKELGDLLFLLVLLARMHEEAGDFTVNDALTSVAEKMIRRHPHVFDPHYDGPTDDGDLALWESNKAKERSADSSALDGVPKGLPALLKAHRIGEKAGAVGFDWPDRSGVRAKVEEELAELDEALESGDEDAIAHEYGDLLLSVVNMGRFLPVGPETALRTATERFERRFRALEIEIRKRGLVVHEASPEALNDVWELVKTRE
ncbi:MAG: MazG family protein [Myxococcota bacterium]